MEITDGDCYRNIEHFFFVYVHLRCIANNLKKISKMSTLEKFLRTPVNVVTPNWSFAVLRSHSTLLKIHRQPIHWKNICHFCRCCKWSRNRCWFHRSIVCFEPDNILGSGRVTVIKGHKSLLVYTSRSLQQVLKILNDLNFLFTETQFKKAGIFGSAFATASQQFTDSPFQ